MDRRGFIIPLDESDLSLLVEAAIEDDSVRTYQLLKDRFDRLVL
jgi:hypothetical protein